MNNKLSTENSKCNQTIRLINQIKALSDKTKNIMAKVKENNYKLDETSLNKINKDFLSEKRRLIVL